ncbi:dicarboxylate transport [Novosphingobium kunmingense]|uniref:Dicarboxylate transport n=1 Tax=Novosphingobium kunmingense TaxID=1211806 RepID=A0A2N0I1A2_9SPHN|nr:YdbH domain-containing protein [Novosphingobium kunmingense]PKB24969.1 dicarboxylate transport [Novosphingobium kunmingense]
MTEAAGDTADQIEVVPARRKRSCLALALMITAVLGLVTIGVVWWQRYGIANRIIAGQLGDLGLPATYKIESISTRHQVLTDIVIGDPRRPDLTVERAIVQITPRFGTPTIETVTLIRPRLYGTLRDAKISFGTLDKVLFRDTGGEGGLPDLNLTLVDGRARLETDMGVIGVKAEGAGNLRGGFNGMIAAVAPELAFGSCKATGASAFGAVKVMAAKPGFAGPLRFGKLDCPAQGLAIRSAALQLTAETTEKFDRFAGTYDASVQGLAMAGAAMAASTAKGDFTYAGGDVTASYDLAAKDLRSTYGAAGALGLEGVVRTRDRFATIEADGAISGEAVRPSQVFDKALADAALAGRDTLVAPLASQIRAALLREGRASSLTGTYVFRKGGNVTSLVVPRAALRGTSGADILALSRFQLTAIGKATPQFVGNFVTGGEGLPRIEGRIEAQAGGTTLGRFRMAEYRAGDTRLALPELALVQRPGGELGFAGRAQVTGRLPGGIAQNLLLPIDGTWSSARGLSVWRRCTPVAFDRIAVGSISLDRRSLVLCPGGGGAILRSDRAGTRFAVGTSSLNLSGKLGSTPLRMRSGAFGFAWPGAVAANNLVIELGPVNEATLLNVRTLRGTMGAVSSGTFAGTDFKLANVPLDVFDAGGRWRWVGKDMALSGVSLRLEDRLADARFRPLVARDASLTLKSTTFTADAVLREPRSDRHVVTAHIVHDLDSERGFADLDVPGLVFDRQMQPTTLTRLALGVIANANGTVDGKGRIDWQRGAVTSTGRFHTDSLDFAAAFGPVKGATGTLYFDDLLGLRTARNQTLRFASINPGIEATDGELSFQLEEGLHLQVNGATWPFLDGELRLRPTGLQLGRSEMRRFTLEVIGIEAGRFVERMNLANISASGKFDGTLPLVFDENGGRIEGGKLVSRPPGGNVSYVGELTYKNLGAMANFAFQALRSLDYKQMTIAMDGELEGDIVTRVRFDGVTQGTGARRNFITQRFANLPIQFNVNVRAPFQKLIGTFRSLYDTKALRDPRELGLIDKDGKPVSASVTNPAPAEDPLVQPSDTRTKP